MAKKRKKSEIDFMVIGLSPALLICLLASFVLYLLTVFYSGQYGTRLEFIFFLFVVATVLIARISMEQGREYAALFAAPLAFVCLLAIIRLIRVPGSSAVVSIIYCVPCFALIWWLAHKLTWNCTLIDEDEDATGEGLLMSMGWDDEELEDDQEAESAPPAPATDPAEASSSSFWQTFLAKQRGRHAPGAMVIYFCLVALPLIGICQWFLPDDVQVRRHSFHLMFVFLASGLGLLLTTSFLGLRRYLRQRGLKMPGEMATSWLLIGGAVVVGFLLLVMILPRPGAGHAISRPFSLGSPDHNRTNQFALGNDGPQTDQQASRTREDPQKSGKGAPTKAGKQGSGSQGEKSSQAGKSQSGQSQSGKSQSGKSQSGKSQSGQSQSGQSQSGQSQSGQSQSGKSQSGKSQSGKSSGEPDGGEKSGKKGDGQAGKQASSDNSPEGQRSDDRNKKSGEGSGERNDPSSLDKNDGAKSAPSFASSRSKPSQAQSQKSRSSSRSSGQRSSSNPLSRAMGGLGLLIKLLFYAALLAAVAFLVWRFRHELAEGWRKLMADLKQWWEGLFGRRPAESVIPSEEATSAARESHRPFSDYRSPFVGDQCRLRPDELVRYSFEAMEAWAREHGHPRDPDQTAQEFVIDLYQAQPGLGRECIKLGQLYGQSAYGDERVSADQVHVLQSLWGTLAGK